MHATPIQIKATVQTATRAGIGTNNPTSNAVRGIHHANKVLDVLASQSRDVSTAVMYCNS
jgi:hypothetical protein